MTFATGAVLAGPNTLELPKGVASPPAKLADVAWLAGHWQGEAFGGQTEEIWSAPAGGSMMGSFRLVAAGEVQFYELEIIRQVGKTLILQLKHFNADLTGWEEQDETIDFPLVKIEPDALYFSGFTVRRINENEMHMYVMVDDEDGEEEVSFVYHRVLNNGIQT